MKYKPPRCTRCQARLFGEIEVDVGVCDDCAEALYERSQRLEDWDRWHPGEPAPECELDERRKVE